MAWAEGLQSDMTKHRMHALIIVALGTLLSACALAGAPARAQQAAAQAAPLFAPQSVQLGMLTEGRSEPFSLVLTNMSGREIEVTEIVPSCGCTVVEYEKGVIGPGLRLAIKGHIDTTGKVGLIDKSLAIYTNLSPEPFSVSLRASVLHDGSSVAGVDTTQLFKGQCATCHSPKGSPVGERLYNDICLMCHRGGLSQNAAIDRAALESIIARGITGTSMPAYAQAHEGPLTDSQIASLAEYILQCFNSSAHSSDAPGAKAEGLLESTGGITIAPASGKGLCAEGD